MLALFIDIDANNSKLTKNYQWIWPDTDQGSSGGGLVTCPGFAGYCSESYPGDTCLVVCAFGRNNVPVCQVRL